MNARSYRISGAHRGERGLSVLEHLNVARRYAGRTQHLGQRRVGAILLRAVHVGVHVAVLPLLGERGQRRGGVEKRQ